MEQLVGFVKRAFLDGRVYNGVDSLKKETLAWLDTTGNETISSRTGLSPRDVFVKESKDLIPVDESILRYARKIYYINKTLNTIWYKCVEYGLPRGTNLIIDRVEVEEQEGSLILKNPDTGVEICRHKVQSRARRVIVSELQQDSVAQVELEKHFKEDRLFQHFFEMLKVQMPRHISQQSSVILRAAKIYSRLGINTAFYHCMQLNICNFTELMTFLILKNGDEFARIFLIRERVVHYSKRSKELEAHYGK